VSGRALHTSALESDDLNQQMTTRSRHKQIIRCACHQGEQKLIHRQSSHLQNHHQALDQSSVLITVERAWNRSVLVVRDLREIVCWPIGVEIGVCDERSVTNCEQRQRVYRFPDSSCPLLTTWLRTKTKQRSLPGGKSWNFKLIDWHTLPVGLKNSQDRR